MGMNTMYKHLARHIKVEQGKYEVPLGANATIGIAAHTVRELALNYAAEMEKRMPSSFDRAEFLKQAGVADDGRQHVEAT